MKIRCVETDDGRVRAIVSEAFTVFDIDFPEEMLFTPWEDTPALKVTVRIGTTEDVYSADSVAVSKGVLTVREDGGESAEYPLAGVAQLDVKGAKKKNKHFFSGKRIYYVKERKIHRKAAGETARDEEWEKILEEKIDD